MKTTRETPTTTALCFGIRPMEERDLAQSAEIESDAFPTLFPLTSFRRELKNRVASYLVAWRADEAGPQPSGDEESGRPLVGRLIHGAQHMWGGRRSAWEPGQDFLAGFVGTWYAGDEAHIVSIGVRTDLRGYGIGELLLIGGIEQAMARQSIVVTLETRKSNHVARRLYEKYGFEERGVRKGYYSDNREDALIMTTPSIHIAPYPDSFRRLVVAHERHWSHAERRLA